MRLGAPDLWVSFLGGAGFMGIYFGSAAGFIGTIFKAKMAHPRIKKV